MIEVQQLVAQFGILIGAVMVLTEAVGRALAWRKEWKQLLAVILSVVFAVVDSFFGVFVDYSPYSEGWERAWVAFVVALLGAAGAGLLIDKVINPALTISGEIEARRNGNGGS